MRNCSLKQIHLNNEDPALFNDLLTMLMTIITVIMIMLTLGSQGEISLGEYLAMREWPHVDQQVKFSSSICRALLCCLLKPTPLGCILG